MNNCFIFELRKLYLNNTKFASMSDFLANYLSILMPDIQGHPSCKKIFNCEWPIVQDSYLKIGLQF